MTKKPLDQTAREALAWDRYLDDLLRDPDSEAKVDLSAEDAALLRALVAVEQGESAADPARQARVWTRALAAARAESAAPRRVVALRSRGLSRPLALRIASIASVILLVAATTLWLSPGARANVAQLACLVPGLGIRDCAAASIVAAEPVAVTRGGATFTVLALLSSGGQTTVRVEVTGLPAPPPDAPSPAGQLNVTLRGADGQTYPRVGKGGLGGIIPRVTPNAFGVSAEGAFAALNPDTRAVDIELFGPPTVGNWQVRVPVVPVQEAALPIAQEGGEGVTLHGVTVRVTNVAADRRGLAVQLLAQTDSADRLVRGDLGGMRYGRRLTLRDDQGRSWVELPPAQRQVQNLSGSVTDEALFAPLSADVTSATLTVPFVTVEEVGEASTLRVPLAGRQVGDQFAAPGDFILGGFRVRVTNITLAEDNKGNRRLWFDIVGGEWADGRKFVAPGGSSLDGVDRGCGASYRGDVSQITRLCVSLPPDYGDEVTVTLRNPIVAISGPWEIAVPIPVKR